MERDRHTIDHRPKLPPAEAKALLEFAQNYQPGQQFLAGPVVVDDPWIIVRRTDE